MLDSTHWSMESHRHWCESNGTKLKLFKFFAPPYFPDLETKNKVYNVHVMYFDLPHDVWLNLKRPLAAKPLLFKILCPTKGTNMASPYKCNAQT